MQTTHMYLKFSQWFQSVVSIKNYFFQYKQDKFWCDYEELKENKW